MAERLFHALVLLVFLAAAASAFVGALAHLVDPEGKDLRSSALRAAGLLAIAAAALLAIDWLAHRLF